MKTPAPPETEQAALARHIDINKLAFEWYDDILGRWFPAPSKATATHLSQRWDHKIRITTDVTGIMNVDTMVKWLVAEGWETKPTGHGGFFATHPKLANVDLEVGSEDDKTIGQINVDLEGEHVLSIYPRMGMAHTTRLILSLFATH